MRDAGGVKVSVLVVCYNHERFVTQAIDSVLMQQTNFDYEIVIGDDCSSDGTPALLAAMQAEHGPGLRVVRHDRRLGPRGNFRETLKACRGDYVACLDGDDYWLSADKLQKQADFLDAHPGCPLCCHNARFVYDDAGIESTLVQTDRLEPFLDVEALLVRSPALTTTTMLRRRVALVLDDMPVVLLGDKTRAVVAAHRFGPIGYLDEALSAWRVHAGGIMNRDWQLPPSARRVASHRTQIEFLEAIDAFLDYRYHQAVCRQVVPRRYALAWLALRRGQLGDAVDHLRRGWRYPAAPATAQSLASALRSLRLLVDTLVAKIGSRLRRRPQRDPRFKIRSGFGVG